MNSLDQRVAPLLAGLQSDPKLPPHAEDLLRTAIASSPYLTHLLGEAAEKRQIGRIAISHGWHNGGHFEPGKDGAPGTLFVSDTTFSAWDGRARLDLLVQTLGHEAMHGVLEEYRATTFKEFTDGVAGKMQEAYENRDSMVDLTQTTGTYLDFTRRNEALAEISALRALNSRIAAEHPDALANKLEDDLLARAQSRCLVPTSTGQGFAPGLNYDDLIGMPHRSPALTAAVERCYYDGPATLGQHGDSDYRNYNAPPALSWIAKNYDALAQGLQHVQQRHPPEVRLDLVSLGIDPAQVERNGLDLGTADKFTVNDMGPGGLGWVQLHNTGSSPDSPQAAQATRVALTPYDSGHQDYALLQGIRSQVGALDAAAGRSFDQRSENMSASLLALAKDNGLTQVDHVLLSQQTAQLDRAHNLILVQGQLEDPAKLRAHMPTAEAAQQPVSESFEKLEEVNQRQHSAHQQDMQRSQEQELHQRAISM